MLHTSIRISIVVCTIIFFSCSKNNPSPDSDKPLVLNSIELDGRPFSFSYSGTSLSPVTTIHFSEPVDRPSSQAGITLSNVFGNIPLNFTFSHHDSAVVVQPLSALKYLSTYTLTISTAVTSVTKKHYGSSSIVRIVTQLDPSPKFPTIADDELLTKTQRQTF